jgi:hypothetical protein
MSDPICVRCARPLADGSYCCDRCASQAAQKLAEIAEVAPASRDVANGLSRRSHGGASGKPGSRLPLDLYAAARMTMTEDRLTRWCRQIAAKRGIAPPWVTTYGEAIEAACGWLSGQTEWIRHQGPTTDRAWLHVFGWDPAEIDNIDAADPPIIASAFLGYIDDAARVLRSIVREPADKKFFGICGSEIGWDDDGEEFQRDEPCKGQVYGLPGAEEATCRACKARWETGPRAKELGDKVREHAFSAKWIHEAYGINVKTIRSWADRGHLKSYWRTEAGLTVEWVDPVLDPKLEGEAMEKRLGEISDEIQARGGRLHYVGDVLDLAAGDAARREGDRATRARRAAARAADDERLSA